MSTDNMTSSRLASSAVKRLSAMGLRLATAESCTGGLVSKLITGVPGASVVYNGGVVSYANEVKASVLGVPWETLNTVGAVSEETALYMADGARRVCGADIAVSTTGIAGPGGGTPEKPVGTVYIAISSDFCRRAELLQLPSELGRGGIRAETARRVLALLTKTLESQNEIK